MQTYYIMIALLALSSISATSSEIRQKKAQEIKCQMFDTQINAIKDDLNKRYVKLLGISKWNPFKGGLKREIKQLEQTRDQLIRDKMLMCPASPN